MRTANSNRCTLNWYLSDLFCLLRCTLDRCSRLIQLDDHAFARAFGIANAMSAITQTRVRNLTNQDAGLDTTYVKNADRVVAYFRHASLCKQPNLIRDTESNASRELLWTSRNLPMCRISLHRFPPCLRVSVVKCLFKAWMPPRCSIAPLSGLTMICPS